MEKKDIFTIVNEYHLSRIKGSSTLVKLTLNRNYEWIQCDAVSINEELFYFFVDRVKSPKNILIDTKDSAIKEFVGKKAVFIKLDEKNKNQAHLINGYESGPW